MKRSVKIVEQIKENSARLIPQILLLVGHKVLNHQDTGCRIHDVLTGREVDVTADISSEAKNALWLQSNRLVHRELFVLSHFHNFQ